MTGVRLFQAKDYRMTLDEQRVAVRLAKGDGFLEASGEKDWNQAIATCKAVQVKALKAFGSGWKAALRDVPLASICVILMCLSVVMEDHAIVRGSPRASRATRRRDESEQNGQQYERAACASSELVIPKEQTRWVF